MEERLNHTDRSLRGDCMIGSSRSGVYVSNVEELIRLIQLKSGLGITLDRRHLKNDIQRKALCGALAVRLHQYNPLPGVSVNDIKAKLVTSSSSLLSSSSCSYVTFEAIQYVLSGVDGLTNVWGFTRDFTRDLSQWYPEFVPEWRGRWKND